MERWISVTEALPQDLEEVIITWINHNPVSLRKHIKDKPFTGFAVYYHEHWYWWADTAADYLAKYGLLEPPVSRFAIDGDVEIVAWMRKPQPYKKSEGKS